MENVTIRIRNRKLEQTLFNLGEWFIGTERDEDGMTVWIYPNKEKVRTIIKWFRESAEKNRERMCY